MNVNGAFILAETHRKTLFLLIFVDNSMQIFLSYISHYEFGKCRELVQRCLNTCNSCVF